MRILSPIATCVNIYTPAEQDGIHKGPIILNDNLQCEYHQPYCPPTSVMQLQLLHKHTNTGTSTAQTAETQWSVTHQFAHSPNLWHQLGSLTLPVPEPGDFVELMLSHVIAVVHKQTNIGTSTALTAETQWSTCKWICALSKLVTST
jgi:hypothetical protein